MTDQQQNGGNSGGTDGSAPRFETQALQDTPVYEQVHPKEQLSGDEWARLLLAKWVLGVSAALMLLAWFIPLAGAWLWAPPGACLDPAAPDTAQCTQALEVFSRRASIAEGVFEFAKSWIPPIITLVLGYYFARERNAGGGDGSS